MENKRRTQGYAERLQDGSWNSLFRLPNTLQHMKVQPHLVEAIEDEQGTHYSIWDSTVNRFVFLYADRQRIENLFEKEYRQHTFFSEIVPVSVREIDE